MKRHLNKMYVSWIDEIEDFRFNVTHLPGMHNQADPLTSSGTQMGPGRDVNNVPQKVPRRFWFILIVADCIQVLGT